MPRTRPPYSAAFRQQMIELVRSGRTPEALASEFEPTAQTIRNWVRQADRDAGLRHDGLTTAEREELNALAESFFATLECELFRKRPFRSHVEARHAVFRYIEGRCNTRRRHSALDHMSPLEYERSHLSAA